jgi:multiple sugar transport system substrate-binding protein
MKGTRLMQRSMNRRRLVTTSGASGAALALGTPGLLRAAPSGSQRRSRVAQDGESITFWVISSFTPDENAPIYEAVAQFQEATGIEVVVESTQASEMRNKLTTAVLGGAGPDVVSVDSAWNAGLAASGITSDLTDRFSPLSDQFFPGPVESGAYLGQQYAVPWYTNNVGLFYNRGMFSAAGIDAPPATWEELVDVGMQLTTGDQYGLMLGASGFGAFTFWPFAFQNGATLISQDGTTAEFGNDPGREAWKYYADLYLTHGIVPEDIKSATTAWDQVFAPFIQERAAMVMSGDWAIFAINDGNPDMDFAVAPLPSGKEAATVIGGYNLAIPQTTGKADAAWQFIEWMTAVEQEWILQGYNRIQARADIVDTEYASQDPNIQVFIEQSAVGRARATVPAWDEIENTIVADAWDSVILGAATPDEALDAAVEQANDVLAES